MKSITVVLRKKTNKQEAYSSLTAFVEHNKKYKDKLDHFYYCISKKKCPYEDDEIMITRSPLIGPIKEKKK